MKNKFYCFDLKSRRLPQCSKLMGRDEGRKKEKNSFLKHDKSKSNSMVAQHNETLKVLPQIYTLMRCTKEIYFAHYDMQVKDTNNPLAWDITCFSCSFSKKIGLINLRFSFIY